VDSLAFRPANSKFFFMALAQNIPRLSEADYLRSERQAEFRSEYFDGEVFAMAGGTRAHSLIATNLLREVSSRLKTSDCVAYNTDLRVKVEATGLLTYPDVSVVCGAQRFLDEEEDTLLNPTVVIEVISDSTEAYDRGKKFENYRQIPTCREYLLVSQKEPRIEQFIRQPNGEWALKEAAGLDAEIKLPSLGIVLPLREVFAKVQFAPARLRTSA
jgi:Uma2 family endonuclease